MSCASSLTLLTRSLPRKSCSAVPPPLPNDVSGFSFRISPIRFTISGQGNVWMSDWGQFMRRNNETYVLNLQQICVESVHVDETGHARDKANQLDHEESSDDDEEENMRHRLPCNALRNEHVVEPPRRVRKPAEARVIDARDEEGREAQDKESRTEVSFEEVMIAYGSHLQKTQHLRQRDTPEAFALVVQIHLVEKLIEVVDVRPLPQRLLMPAQPSLADVCDCSPPFWFRVGRDAVVHMLTTLRPSPGPRCRD